jgi:glycosyltransferase involved in cell wall biosynthesis
MNKPLISVILPCYNAEKTIYDSLISIVKQTYENMEIILINDGSTDASEEVIKKIDDARIVYIKNKNNLGLIKTLNKGLYLAKGKYIARMDADDISMSKRFEVQVNFLESNPEYIICSANRIEFNDTNSKKHVSRLPIDDLSIRLCSIFSTPFTHSCVMFRRDIIINNNLQYNSNYKSAEDYELWINILKFGKAYNFTQALLYYRYTSNSQTALGILSKDSRKEIISNIQCKALEVNGIILEDKALELQYILSLSNNIKNIDFGIFPIKYIKTHFFFLYKQLVKLEKYPSHLIYENLGERYFKILAFNLRKISLFKVIYFLFSCFFIYGFISYLTKIKCTVKKSKFL